MEKTDKKFGDTEIKKHKLHQYERPTSIKNVDISKIVASNKILLGKKGFRYFTEYKDAKKLNLYAYFFQK